jgi:hypothetical protein
MTKKGRKAAQVCLSALEDEWLRRATAASIQAVRGVIQGDGPIPLGTPIGRLGDVELGWLISATAENLDVERAIRTTGLDPEPWDTGAVTAILPELADACPDIDWSKPLSEWSRETMAEFLLTAMRLVKASIAARDLSERGVTTRKSNASVIARQVNAAAGGPLMDPTELNDEIAV